MNWKEWRNDPVLAKKLGALFAAALGAYEANPNLIAEHANLEQSIRVGGYANRTLLELVQNAADALAVSSDGLRGRVEIVLDRTQDVLYCANEGSPFKEAGLTALMHAHLSAKRGDEIGRFGLGFKSVLAVTSQPQVFSRSVSFEFNSLQAQEQLCSLASTGELPVLRTATLIADPARAIQDDPVLSDLCTWASTVVRLPGVAASADKLFQEIKNFRSEFLLFVGSVREVRMRMVGDELAYDQIHSSREVSPGQLRIETPSGSGSTWLVATDMFYPSSDARREVGATVAREQIKLTVAVPRERSTRPIGEFWSYFPLQDRTSASALFNAPWSVNDDRTTLLQNQYNREIALRMAKMFVEMMPQLSSAEDPAAHFDFLPARGRESLSFGDTLLTAHVPALAASHKLVPDAAGALRSPSALTPLDFGDVAQYRIGHSILREWSEDCPGHRLPHWSCYLNDTRRTRLRALFVAELLGPGEEMTRQAEAQLLPRVRSIGILSWLRAWAESSQLGSSKALKLAADAIGESPELADAHIVPTTAGLKRLRDSGRTFLRGVDDISLDGADFVDPDFLALPGIVDTLRRLGFRELDPHVVFEKRLESLGPDSSPEEAECFWASVTSVSTQQAARLIYSRRERDIPVPIIGGGWAPASEVWDVPALAETSIPVLDRDRCEPKLAHAAGVIHKVVTEFPLESESCSSRYQAAALKVFNATLGRGESPAKNIEFDQYAGPGPISVLVQLAEAGADSGVIKQWTSSLAASAPESLWTAEDVSGHRTRAVPSPVCWAISEFGIVDSNEGPRRPSGVVSPSMLRYAGILPLSKASRALEDLLDLPRELDEVSVHLFKEAFAREAFPPNVRDDGLVEFVLAGARAVCAAGGSPSQIPARVGKAIERHGVENVYLATTDEQQLILARRQRPYLRVPADLVDEYVRLCGCKRFEDSFSFSTIVEGEQEPELLFDLFPGLKMNYSIDQERLREVMVIRAHSITKRVSTDDGVEDQALSYLKRSGSAVVVPKSLSEHQLLATLNIALDMRLSNLDLEKVQQIAVDQMLERARQEAKSATSDADRLDIFFGPDTLREKLPNGLWQALEAQGLVDKRTDIAKLFLVVYGSDAVKELRDEFQQAGYEDVPGEWAGGGATIDWLRRMGFGPRFAGRPADRQPDQFLVPGAVQLGDLHSFQKKVSEQLRRILTIKSPDGRAQKGMVELPTGAGKTREATETLLKLFKEDVLEGPVLWIAQSIELCEQAVQTFGLVWRHLGDERPISVGRLWSTNTIREPDTKLSVVVATDAKLASVLDMPEYEWLRTPAAVFVDEAHRTGGSTRYTDLFRQLGVDGHRWDRPLVGLSATPFKGSAEDSRGTRDLAARFDNQIISSFENDAYRELQQLGILAKVRHEVLAGVDVELSTGDEEDIRNRGLIQRNLMEKLGRDQQRLRILADHILGLDNDWPVLVFTPSVLSAQVLAATLRYRGVSAAAVSGQTGRQERRDAIERFKRGEIRVLANCDLLIQGFDAPGVRALYIARPTFSPSTYIQMAGRGLRGPKNGGKEECLIVDVADNFGACNDFLGYHEYKDLWKVQQ